MKKAMLGYAVMLMLAAPFAYAEHPHVHGTAQLGVVIDGSMLQLDFNSPLDNLLGFEHAPRNDQEKQALQAMMDKLHKPTTLFVPTVAARCVPQSPQITTPFAATSAIASKPDSHADFDATFAFRCEMPAALKDIEVKLFDAFPGLHKVKVQLATPRGQSAAMLTAQQHRLSW